MAGLGGTGPPPDPLPIFEALGNSTRLQMLELMASHKEICVCELVQILGLSQSGVSSHLTVLRRAGIVTSRKEGLWVFYGVDQEAIQQAFAALETDLLQLLELAAAEDPDARLREKIGKDTCCASAASKRG